VTLCVAVDVEGDGWYWMKEDSFCENNLTMVEIVVCQDEVREVKLRVS